MANGKTLISCGFAGFWACFDLLITNQLLYRLSYISLSIHDMVFLERHIQNRIYFIIFFDRRQQILLISCHTLCMAIPVYYILYFEGIPSKYKM